METNTTVPLRNGLGNYVIPNKFNGKMFHHPLHIQVFYDPMLNDHINKSIEYKETKLKESLKEKKWSSYIFLHERPYRLDAFKKINKKLPDKEWWELFREVYQDQEYLWQFFGKISYLLEKAPEDKKNFFMDEKEREVFKSLPETITIYRGQKKKGWNHIGMSWSLSKEKAEWFANRFDRNGIVVSAEIEKKNILGFLSDREEKEIVIHPDKLTPLYLKLL